MNLAAVDSFNVTCINQPKTVVQKLARCHALVNQIADRLISEIGSGSVVETRDFFQRLIETGIDFGGQNDFVHRIKFRFSLRQRMRYRVESVKRDIGDRTRVDRSEEPCRVFAALGY